MQRSFGLVKMFFLQCLLIYYEFWLVACAAVGGVVYTGSWLMFWRLHRKYSLLDGHYNPTEEWAHQQNSSG